MTVCNAKVVFLFNVDMSAPITSHSLQGCYDVLFSPLVVFAESEGM